MVIESSRACRSADVDVPATDALFPDSGGYGTTDELPSH